MLKENTKGKEEKGNITVKQILIIVKEILEVIISGMPEDKAIARASKKYNISTKILTDALEKHRA